MSSLERVPPSQLSFQTLCQFLDKLWESKGKKKKEIIDKFIKQCILRESGDAFSVFRLVLPALDEKRGNYKLQEQKVIEVMLKAHHMDPKTDSKAKMIKGWRRPGRKGDAAGDLARTLEMHLFKDVCFVGEGTPEAKKLKIREINDELDKLVKNAGKVGEQAKIFRNLMNKTTAHQMFCLVQIILKNLRLGVSERTIFNAWHPDAQEYFNNNGLGLEAVFRDLLDRGKMYASSIVPGRAVRPQLAAATYTSEMSWRRLHNKPEKKPGRRDRQQKDELGPLRPFIIETKFDGERIQVHRDKEGKICYFSRKAIEHGEHSNYSVLDPIFQAQVRHKEWILDGELAVWNKARQVFEPFGGLKAVINAVRDKKGCNEVLEVRDWDGGLLNEALEYKAPLIGDCELVYVAFDILYVEDQPVVKKPLEERHQLLKAAIDCDPPRVMLSDGSCIYGRVVPLLPEETTFGQTKASRYGKSKEDIEHTLQEMHNLGEEGIVVKALDSPWIADDRHSGHWLKLKPDYFSNLDIDAVVIGGWWGEKRRAGGVAQYLLALPDRHGDDYRWVTFCRVGSGFSDKEREMFYQTHLKDNLTEDVAHPPSYYDITGNEKPDVWVVDPYKAPVLNLHADLRTIVSSVYATHHSVRFPRIAGTRFDKTATTATSVKELEDMVEQRKEGLGINTLANDEGEEEGNGAKRSRGRKRRAAGAGSGKGAKKKRTYDVVAGFGRTDVSQVKRESKALAGAVVYFAGYGNKSKEEAEKLVASLGGDEAMAYVPSKVTHILAGPHDNGYHVKQHKKADRDIISIDWLEQCNAQRRRVPLRQRHYLHLSEKTLESSAELDRYGDAYLSDVNASDVDMLLRERMRDFKLDALALATGLSEESDFEEGPVEATRAAQRRLAGRRGGGKAYSPQGLLLYLDSQLAAVGMLDPRFTLLRGCTAFLLDVGIPADTDANGGGTAEGSAAAVTAGAAVPCGLYPDVARLRVVVDELSSELHKMRTRQLSSQARLHGAEVSSSVHEGLTHLVCLVGDEAPSISPAALLEAVSRQGGGQTAVAALREGLLEHRIQLVTEGWLEESFQVLEEDPLTAQRASEADHLLNIEDAAHVSSWPWERFEPARQPTRGRSRTVASQLLSQGPARQGRKGRAVAEARRAPRSAAAAPVAVESEPGLVKEEPAGVEQEPLANKAEAGPVRPAARSGVALRLRKRAPEVKAELKEELDGLAAGAAADLPPPTERQAATLATTPLEPLPPLQPSAPLAQAGAEEAGAGAAPAPAAGVSLKSLIAELPAAAADDNSIFNYLFGGGPSSSAPAAAPTPALAPILPPVTQPTSSYMVPTTAAGATEAAEPQDSMLDIFGPGPSTRAEPGVGALPAAAVPPLASQQMVGEPSPASAAAAGPPSQPAVAGTGDATATGVWGAGGQGRGLSLREKMLARQRAKQAQR